MRLLYRLIFIPIAIIFVVFALREPSCSITTPTNSSGQSTVRCSSGSCSLPSIFLVRISGLPTISSYPSRRIVSTRLNKDGLDDQFQLDNYFIPNSFPYLVLLNSRMEIVSNQGGSGPAMVALVNYAD